jgi:hypothetical protein
VYGRCMEALQRGMQAIFRMRRGVRNTLIITRRLQATKPVGYVYNVAKSILMTIAL